MSGDMNRIILFIFLVALIFSTFYWLFCGDSNPTSQAANDFYSSLPVPVREEYEKSTCKREKSDPVTLLDLNSTSNVVPTDPLGDKVVDLSLSSRERSSGLPPCPCHAWDLRNFPEIVRQLQMMHKELDKEALDRPSYAVYTNSYGLPNLASLYFGAEIVSIRDTKPFVPPNSKCGASGCLNVVESVIQPDLLRPGQNWHFQGESGSVAIELDEPAFVSGFTLLHPKKLELPDGFFKSSPKDFRVYGLEGLADPSPNLLGEFSYLEDGPAAQTFPAKLFCDRRYKVIEFKFVTNHGNPQYTAVYKIEIHGDIGKPWFARDKET